MAGDAAAQRGPRPTVFLSLREDPTAGPVVDWLAEALAGRPAPG